MGRPRAKYGEAGIADDKIWLCWQRWRESEESMFTDPNRASSPGERRLIFHQEMQYFSSRRRWAESPFSLRRWVKRWLYAWFWFLLISVGLAILAYVLLK